MARKSVIIDTFDGKELRITQIEPWLCKLEIVDSDGIEILAGTELVRNNMKDLEEIFRYGDFKIDLDELPEFAEEEKQRALSREEISPVEEAKTPSVKVTDNQTDNAGETGDPFEDAGIE